MLCLSTGPARASGLLQDKAVDATGSLRWGYWRSSRRLDDDKDLVPSSIWATASARSSYASLLFDGWLQYGSTEASQDRSELREAYVDVPLGQHLHARVGRQQLAWGRADKLNPTDNVSPRDYTLMSSEDDDQRYGADALKLDWDVSNFTATGLWIPRFEPTSVPFPAAVPLPVQSSVHHNQPGQWAAKLDRSGGTVDWSLSYYQGQDLTPDLGLQAGPAPTLLLSHHPVRVWGSDMASVVGRYGFRAELAYTQTANSDGSNPYIKSPFVYLVAGVERSVLADVNINVQYFGRRLLHHQPPESYADPNVQQVATQQDVLNSQLDATQHGATVRISKDWLNDTLKTEFIGAISVPHRSYAAMPKVVYALNDHWKIAVGADVMNGNQEGVFGRLRSNNGVHLELRRSFGF
jgi:hypothetical protein